MRKTLRIISITAGIISAVSAIILFFIYLEDVIGYVKKYKDKFTNNISEEDLLEEENDFEF